MRQILTLVVVVMYPLASAQAVNKALSVTTDEAATCRACNGADSGCDESTTYDQMDTVGFTFSTTGGTTHEHTLDLPCDAAYIFHVRCTDGSGNANTTSSQIDFSIAAEGVVIPTDDGAPANNNGGGTVSSGCGCSSQMNGAATWLALGALFLLRLRRRA